MFFFLTTGESDTPFGFSNSRAGIIMLILVVAIIIFFLLLKFYDMVKYKHWSDRNNRIAAVRRILNKNEKDFEELDSDDLISGDLVTLYEYYDRSMDLMMKDLGKDFDYEKNPYILENQNTKD